MKWSHLNRYCSLLFFLQLISIVSLSQTGAAQGFYEFIRVIPERDSTGTPLPGANTSFADGSMFIPDGDIARSQKWTWRPLGSGGVLSSLGLSTSSPPTGTRELVTTVKGLKPGTNYSVQVFFWSNDTALWGIRAGFNYANGLRTNPWFDNQSTNVMVADLLPWGGTMPTVFTEGGRFLYAVALGSRSADANGELKVFVHDLPSGDSSIRTWYNGVAISEMTAAADLAVDLGAAGTRFSRGVRGLAIIDISMDRGEYHVAVPKVLQVARGSTIRGVSTGLAAEIYDWRTRNGAPRPPTLEFLRYSRNEKAELFLGANMRGLIEPDPAGGWRYYDTNVSTLATMAGDWVRYVNHIVPTYRLGDTISDPRDTAILNSLTWSSSFPNDSWGKLLAPEESAVPRIQYWEIGNEPSYGVKAYAVSNSYTLNSNDYLLRYKAIAAAIKTEDPTVKVGPTLSHASRESEHLEAILSDPTVPVDFVTYHPYERMGTLDDPTKITLHLGSVHSRQMHHFHEIKTIVEASGRDADAVEYATTEVNVSSWDTNDTDKEARIAHALGTVETVFSHARLGLVASMYWIWPTHRWDGTEYPVFKAYEKLRDHMGDTLLSTYAFRDIRVYTTRDSRTGEIAVWALNFSNNEQTTVQLNLNNVPRNDRARLLRLVNQSGPTTLFSANLSSEMPGGPAIHVDWTSTDVTDQDLSTLTLPPATLSLLVIEPGLEKLTPTLIEEDGVKKLSVQVRAVANGSALRYKLYRSADLSTWEEVAEAQSGAGETISLIDNEPANSATSRFFRVSLVRDPLQFPNW